MLKEKIMLKKRCALMHWSFLVLNGIHASLFWGVDSWNTEDKQIGKITKKMRLDALIIFSIEWNSYELILRGKQLKYWSRKTAKSCKRTSRLSDQGEVCSLSAAWLYTYGWLYFVLCTTYYTHKYQPASCDRGVSADSLVATVGLFN